MRSFVLSLTEEGRQLLDSATPVARNIGDALLQALPQARRELFLQALQAIVKVLEGERV